MGPFVAQGLAAFVASLTTFNVGMINGWATPSLPKLLKQPTNVSDDQNEFKITPDEGSWVVSIINLAAVFGPILMSPMVDRIGRKWSLNIMVLPMLISWLIIGFATSVEILYFGRFIGGLGLSAVYGVTSMYIAEIVEDRIRGALCGFMTIAPFIGQLVMFCIGPWVTRTMLSVVSAIPIIIFLVVFVWMPESPYFWLMTGSREKAAASLIWLRRRSNVDAELCSLEKIVNDNQKNREGFGITRIFRQSDNRRAFIISIGLMSFQQLSGYRAIGAYGTLIFESSGLVGWSNDSVIIMGIVQVVAGISVLFVIDRAGRRPILILSSLFTLFFLICEAVFFHVKYLGYETSSFSWIPLAGLVGYYIAVIPGLGCIPWIMIGELFPTNVKAPASMLLSMSSSALAFVAAKMYEPIDETLGTHWIYYVFAMTTLSGVVFIYLFVPETKRLSLQDIQEKLKTNRAISSAISIGDSCETIVTE